MNTIGSWLLLGVATAILLTTLYKSELILNEKDHFQVLADLHVLPSRFEKGSSVTITNGICNNSKEVHNVIYTLELISQSPSLSSANILIDEGKLTFEPGECEGESITRVFNADMPTGTFQLFFDAEVEETKQKIELVSNVFEIH